MPGGFSAVARLSIAHLVLQFDDVHVGHRRTRNQSGCLDVVFGETGMVDGLAESEYTEQNGA